MAAETNLIKSEDLVKATEKLFALKFNENIKKLMEALGTTRKVAKTAGTNLVYYEVTGVLQDGSVPEGDVIPLSKYETKRVPLKEMEIKKWRNATSVEAISEKGYEQALVETTGQLVKDVQKGIKKNFFDFLATGKGKASGKTLQPALANAWAQLEILFEDYGDVSAVYFINPQDAAEYLGNAPISTQDAFGMKYIEDFLGLGTVIFSSSVPKGKFYATAKENVVLYYIPVNGADINKAFNFTSDATGLIGIHLAPDYDNLTAGNTIMSGVVLFAEKIDGIVVGTIGGDGLGA